jgi:hypothetical protein
MAAAERVESLGWCGYALSGALKKGALELVYPTAIAVDVRIGAKMQDLDVRGDRSTKRGRDRLQQSLLGGSGLRG